MLPQHISYGVLIILYMDMDYTLYRTQEVPLKSNIYSDYEVLIFIYSLFIYSRRKALQNKKQTKIKIKLTIPSLKETMNHKREKQELESQ